MKKIKVTDKDDLNIIKHYIKNYALSCIINDIDIIICQESESYNNLRKVLYDFKIKFTIYKGL